MFHIWFHQFFLGFCLNLLYKSLLINLEIILICKGMPFLYIKNKYNLKNGLTILFLFCCFGLSAQIKISYSIGGIGGNMKTTTYSNPLLISGENCFNVSNALNKFWGSNTGDFFINCVVDVDFIKFSIKINPNPVINYATVKFINKLQNENKMRLTVFSNMGQPMLAFDVTQDQFLSGYRLDMSSLSSGYYFIQISSTSLLQTFKILKN